MVSDEEYKNVVKERDRLNSIVNNKTMELYELNSAKKAFETEYQGLIQRFNELTDKYAKIHNDLVATQADFAAYKGENPHSPIEPDKQYTVVTFYKDYDKMPMMNFFKYITDAVQKYNDNGRMTGEKRIDIYEIKTYINSIDNTVDLNK